MSNQQTQAFKRGDRVKYCGRWMWIVKINRKSVVVSSFLSIGTGIRIQLEDLELVA